jgi:hypothetical protein
MSNAATLVNRFESMHITTNVYYDNGVYQYEYFSSPQIEGRDISNITIDLCDDCKIFGFNADDHCSFEDKDGAIKIDSIKPKGNDFVFSFYSNCAPEKNDAYIKAGRFTYDYQVLSPSCQVPEPETALLGMLGVLCLFRRRR